MDVYRFEMCRKNQQKSYSDEGILSSGQYWHERTLKCIVGVRPGCNVSRNGDVFRPHLPTALASPQACVVELVPLVEACDTYSKQHMETTLLG